MSEAASSTTRGPVNPAKWIALLGRRDEPTDGVEDYCTFLGEALRRHGIELKQARVPWMEKGWIGALRQISDDCSAWRGRWVLLQYTALAWSRRGFPFAALAVLVILRRGDARVAVVFHEPDRQGGSGLLQGVRGACQGWVIRRLYRRAAKAIFTVPLEMVAWLPKGENKAVFIPIGANIPERVNHRAAPSPAGQGKTVIVFGVTGAPETVREIEEIAGVMREASKALGQLRLVVVGRGSIEAREQLAKALERCDVELVVRGILPADEVAHEFEHADVLLFVRGAITPQRGSAIAGVACGLPIVGYRNGDVSGPLKEAGVEWSPWPDRDNLLRGLVRVLSDPSRWTELHERNLEMQKNWFSWTTIGERFCRALRAAEQVF
jgi:glycosyltransferase involved in cell wall biosynthesis